MATLSRCAQEGIRESKGRRSREARPAPPIEACLDIPTSNHTHSVPVNPDILQTVLECLDMSTHSLDHPLRHPASGSQPFRLYTAASVGPAIRHYREEAGLTQQQLADMAGLNRSYLSELEQGRETEQMRRVLRLLKLLGVRATLQKADW